MNAEDGKHELGKITERIIGCAYQVSNILGCGFLEKVYESALAHELRKSKLEVTQQHGIRVQYDGIVVGEFCADLLVEESVLVELKAVKALDEIHMLQCQLPEGDGPVDLPTSISASPRSKSSASF
jgi:GxxExxY protein